MLFSLLCKHSNNREPGPEVIKNMPNSAKHEFFTAHKYRYEKVQHLPGSDKPRFFFMLINLEMPTIVGILTFVCRKKIVLI